MPAIDRRTFVSRGALGAAALALPLPLPSHRGRGGPEQDPQEPWFRISLAQWSLHRTLRSGDLDNLGFPAAAAELGIGAVEYVNSFFRDEAADLRYLRELNRRCKDAGVESLLIMCDGLGALGDPDDARRTRAVENHYPWVGAARLLGCHSIRVNARSSGSREEQLALAADGLRRLTEFAADFDIHVIVENHGGLSSDGGWLAAVMDRVDHPRCGTLPDFGNFHLGGGEWYDRYRGVGELMPYAKAVSAKSHEFDEDGNEVRTDYPRMLRVVHDAGYRGWIGVEYEGDGLSEREGILATKRLLELCRREIG